MADLKVRLYMFEPLVTSRRGGPSAPPVGIRHLAFGILHYRIPMPFPYEEFDLSGVRTYPLASRRSKARAEDFAAGQGRRHRRRCHAPTVRPHCRYAAARDERGLLG